MTHHLMTVVTVQIGGADWFVPMCLTCKWEHGPLVSRTAARKIECGVWTAFREGMERKARRRELTTA